MQEKEAKELTFLKLTGNHQEFARKLRDLGVPDQIVVAGATDICRRWFDLGRKHLREANRADKSRIKRATYSRAYYAAYHGSKAVRYMVDGFVSLKGDDHGKAPDLPNDFPDAAEWANVLTRLYENRLRADYDNWVGSERRFSEKSAEAVDNAREFLRVARRYLKQKYGVFE